MEVLIVEDDDSMAAALTAAVASTGYGATRVARGADALLRHRSFDVILLDLGLPGMVQVGELTLNLDRHVAEVRGRILALTPTEFDLLALLAGNAGLVVTREQILDKLWGDAFLASSRSLDVHLTGLRAKLALPGFIVNVRGVGYRIEADPQ